MRRALALAKRGSGTTRPNPMVGAVVVKDGKVVGAGYHRQAGAAHAELEALQSAGELAHGATLFVTLEPCNHHGRTPPCTEAIIQSGISRVVCAMRDPNPSVKGGGVERLRARGIQVETGLLAGEAEWLNSTWVHWVKTKRPFVVLKVAMTLDGKISRYTGTANRTLEKGQPSSISGSISRAHVHRLRRHFDAILVGARTVIADNPLLTNRTGRGAQPLKVILDPQLEIDLNSRLFDAGGDGTGGGVAKTLVVCTSKAHFTRRTMFEERGIEVLVMEDRSGHVDLDGLLIELGARGIQGVLCEGGHKLSTAMLSGKHCDTLLLYVAPEIFETGLSFTEGGMLAGYHLAKLRKMQNDALLIWRRIRT